MFPSVTAVAGLPVAVTGFVAGCSDGADGYLVGVGDVEAMARRLADLAADPDLRRRLGEAGRESVIQRYRIERLIDDVDALYRELLSDGGLPQPSEAPATLGGEGTRVSRG